MRSAHLLRLGREYASAKGLSLATVGGKVANHGAFFSRLSAGRTITEARADRVARAISSIWPQDMEWPPDIVRPPIVGAPTIGLRGGGGE